MDKVAMVVVAHPDDAEFGSSGTVATWVQEGWDVYYVIATDASGGGEDLATSLSVDARRTTTETRQREQRAAGEILGLKDVLFLNYRDGTLEPSLELRRDITRLLRTYRPTRVICQCPDRVWTPSYSIGRHHPDHLACGEAVLAAIYPASQNAWDFPELLAEGLKPHKVREIFVVGAPVSNLHVDISAPSKRKSPRCAPMRVSLPTTSTKSKNGSVSGLRARARNTASNTPNSSTDSRMARLSE